MVRIDPRALTYYARKQLQLTQQRAHTSINALGAEARAGGTLRGLPPAGNQKGLAGRGPTGRDPRAEPRAVRMST